MTESLDKLQKFHRGFVFFWFHNFYGFIVLGIMKNVWAEPPCHIHLKVHSLGHISPATHIFGQNIPYKSATFCQWQTSGTPQLICHKRTAKSTMVNYGKLSRAKHRGKKHQPASHKRMAKNSIFTFRGVKAVTVYCSFLVCK